jgi:iron complex outermembrane receptor protein
MISKYNKSTIAFFILAGAVSSALFGKNPETLNEMEVRGSNNFEDLDLSRSSVLSGNHIENYNADSISDLSGLASNLYINSYGIQSYGDVITLRGIGNAQLFGDPAVGLYIDGIPQGSTATYSSALFDLESVEVLKGYHGHRFGKNTPGGIIDIKSRKAGDVHRSKMSASYATFNTQNYRVLADGPTGDNSSYYFGLNREKSDGFADNVNPLGNDATSESWNGRLGFDFTTDGGLDIGVGGTWEAFKMGAQPIVHRNSPTGFYKRDSDLNEIGSVKSNSQFVKLETKTDFSGIKSVTSRNQWKLDPNILDLNYADSGLAQIAGILQANGNPISSSSTIKENHNGWSEELSFYSIDEQSFDWMVFLYANTAEIDGSAERNYPMPTVTQSDPTYFDAGVMLPASSATDYNMETDSYALSAAFLKDLNENTSCQIGLRFDHVSKDLKRSKVNSLSPSPADISDNKDYSWLSPSLELQREINENFSTFLKSSLSQKPGGFSPYVDNADLIAAGVISLDYKEEKIWANEVGISFNENQSTSGFAVSFFWNEISDYQFEKPSGAFDYFVDNAEEVEIHGFELDFYTKPSSDWILTGSYAITDGEIKKHSGLSYDSGYDPFAPPVNPPVNPILGPHDFAGKDIPFTPEQTLNFSVMNKLTDNLTWSSGLTYIGKIHYLNQTAADTVNDSYTLWNTSVEYFLNDWKLNLFGTNLTDEKYYSSLVTSLTGAPGIVGSPRVIGLSISRDF